MITHARTCLSNATTRVDFDSKKQKNKINEIKIKLLSKSLVRWWQGMDIL